MPYANSVSEHSVRLAESVALSDRGCIAEGGSVSINLDVVGRRSASRTISWSSSQALLYALGVGAGGSGSHDELAFTTENSHDTPQQVLPTFVAVLAMRDGDASDLGDVMNLLRGAGDFSLAQILHGEQTLILHGAIPVTGTATSIGHISAVYDKGRNAVIESVVELREAVTGDLLAESVSSLVVRDEGGFGGDPGTTPAWAVPERPADVTLSYPTRRDQALLYRLSGDRNPLHSDPWFARSAGLEQPILHGLCTYGLAGRALLHEVCGGDPDRFGSMSARFASMVIPGDTLDIDIWRTTDGAVFRTHVGDRVVLDRGTFRLRTP
jgi:acyl dehydratase